MLNRAQYHITYSKSLNLAGWSKKSLKSFRLGELLRESHLVVVLRHTLFGCCFGLYNSLPTIGKLLTESSGQEAPERVYGLALSKWSIMAHSTIILLLL